MVAWKTMELQCVNYTNEMVQCLYIYIFMCWCNCTVLLQVSVVETVWEYQLLTVNVWQSNACLFILTAQTWCLKKYCAPHRELSAYRHREKIVHSGESVVHVHCISHQGKYLSSRASYWLLKRDECCLNGRPRCYAHCTGCIPANTWPHQLCWCAWHFMASLS